MANPAVFGLRCHLTLRLECKVTDSSEIRSRGARFSALRRIVRTDKGSKNDDPLPISAANDFCADGVGPQRRRFGYREVIAMKPKMTRRHEGPCRRCGWTQPLLSVGRVGFGPGNSYCWLCGDCIDDLSSGEEVVGSALWRPQLPPSVHSTRKPSVVSAFLRRRAV